MAAGQLGLQQMSRVALIDGTGLAFRAFHALPGNLKTTGGLRTNAIYGFAQMFRKLLAGRTPELGAVVFDAPQPTARHRAFAGYKAHRPPMPQALREQLPWIDRLVEAHDYPILRVPGVEADDVIGTLTHQALDAGHEVYIVSGDKDFAQLVGPRVRLLDSTREVLYDADTVFRRWGVRPGQFADWLALAGDTADGIPGVPGVGGAIAAQLLAKHGDLDAILTDPPADRTGRALRTHAERARLSRDLARIRTDLSLPTALADLVVPAARPEKLNAIYRELEFFSLLSAEQAAATTTTQSVSYFVCDTPELAQAALAHETSGPEPVALHVLHELPTPLRGAVVGLALSPSLGRGVYLPLAGPGANLGPQGIELARAWLEDPERPKLCHEEKSAWVALQGLGVELRGVVGDTALASYLVDPTKHLPHRLEQVAREYLHVGLQPLRGVIGRGRARKRFAELSVDRAGAWACHCADAVGAAWRVLRPLVRDCGQWAQLVQRDMPLSAVLGRMERTGVRVDPDALRALGAQFAAEKGEVEARIHALAGRRFNPGSLKQLGTVLFEELGLPVLKRTRTGYSTDATVLERLRSQHAIIDEVLRWRTLARLIHTYTDVLVAAIDPRDGRIHSTFQQTVSASGRLISTEPDLQRTPVRTEEFRALRRAFRPSEGSVLVSADWSQIELRLLAHLSGDPALVWAFRSGADIHARTAAELFGIGAHEVQPAQRDVGKTVNFATAYGQGPGALAQQLGVSRGRARAYIDRWFDTYAGVAAWRAATTADAYRDGYVTTLLGRRRYVPELTAHNPTDRAHGERIATNTPVQGSGADLCRLAMLRIGTELRARCNRATMVLTVHDELLFDVPTAEQEEVVALVRQHMEGVAQLSVPLVVEIGVGASWAEAHSP